MIELLVQFISSFRCLYTITPGQAGVLCRLGKFKRTLGPGLYFVTPFIDDFTIVPTAEQINDLRAQSITTSDGKSVLISGKIRYVVTDAAAAIHNVLNFDDSLADEALGLIATEGMKRTWIQCLSHEDLANEIEKDIRRTAKVWGISISGFTITDMVEHRVVRVEGNKQYLPDESSE